MGNYRFRLSSMMPNAWFYKLKDMRGGSRGHGILNSNKQSNHHSRITAPVPPPRYTNSNRASCYFTSREQPEKLPNSPIHPKASDTRFPVDPPRKSKRMSRRLPDRPSTKLVSSVSSGCAALGSVCKPESIPDNLLHQHVEKDDPCKTVTTDQVEFSSLETWSQSFNCSVSSSATDIIIDVDRKSSLKQTFDAAATVLDLPPILTKPLKKLGNSVSEQESPPRRVSQGIHRIKIRGSSPKTASKRIEPNRRSKAASRSKEAIQKWKGLQESFAVVKSSSDPERDFRDSMMEMIVENNLHASKDLEELLACYLTLNSKEYHDVIVSVFKQIWFELLDIRF